MKTTFLHILIVTIQSVLLSLLVEKGFIVRRLKHDIELLVIAFTVSALIKKIKIN